jgi:signal transduction histidine kinase
MQWQRLLCPSQPLLRLPLRVALVVPFVLQLSAAVGLTAYLSLKNGQNAVNEVASQLRDEVTARIHQHVTDYLATPQLVTEINAKAIQFGELDVADGRDLERHCWQQMQIFTSLSPIAFANEQGEIHAVDRLSDGSLVIRVIDASTGGVYHTYTVDEQGDRVALIRTSQTFDPRTRPWYTKAVAMGQPTWTEIYSYFSSPGLAISAARPLYRDGTLVGVTNATLSLSQLSDFLQDLTIGRSGQTFIIEHSGNLVASSSSEEPFVSAENGAELKQDRLAAVASRDAVTRQTAQYLQTYFGNFKNIRRSQQLDFILNRQRQFVQVMPFADRYGLEWLIVVVVPEADFMQRIEANRRVTIWLCLIALLLATAIGILTARWISEPILRLSAASRKIADGELAQTLPVQGIEELQVLVQAHNQMASQLQASFTALAESNEALEQRVEQRTAELKERTLQLQQAYNLEAMLKRITDKVRDSLDEAQIFQTVVEELSTVLKTECCATASYDLEQNHLVIEYEWRQSHWPDSLGQIIRLEDIPGIHQCLLQGRSLQFCQLYPKFGRPQAAVLACPIFDNQGILADLWLFRQPDYTYSELEIRLVQQVANQCAIAIRQAQLYQAVHRQVEELKSLNQLKDDFLSTVSHELRTPISNMKLAIHMLKLAPSPERQQQYLDILQAECTREADLINDLLDLQRLEANHDPITVEAIELQPWLSSAIDPFLSRIQERQQVLTLDISPEISMIYSDRASLGRLLAELLNNACKYTPSHGEIRLKIGRSPDRSNPARPADFICIEISNQAEIPATELPRIFEKFYRIPQADPWRQGGTGLGLALAQKLVEQLEGALQVNSSGGWTTFTILLKNQL